MTACTTPRDEPSAAAAPSTATSAHAAAIERELAKRIADGPAELRDVRAVLVSVDSTTVVEHYRSSKASESAHVFSVTKSVMSILVGIAVDQGQLKSLDQTLGESLPRYRSRMSEEVAGITLRQLLTHTSGMPDSSRTSSTDFDLAAPDLVGRFVSYELLNDPGSVFEYSNAGSHLIGAVLAEATGRPVLEYARDNLFDPLGITTRPAYEGFEVGPGGRQFETSRFAWAADRQGVHSGCCWLKLTAPDMLKLGELYLTEGTWRGQRIVSADWVRASTASQLSPEQVGPPEGYGYLWWLGEVRGHRGYVAAGSFGQLIAVLPDLKLVIAISTRDDGDTEAIDLDPLVDAVVAGLE